MCGTPEEYLLDGHDSAEQPTCNGRPCGTSTRFSNVVLARAASRSHDAMTSPGLDHCGSQGTTQKREQLLSSTPRHQVFLLLPSRSRWSGGHCPQTGWFARSWRRSCRSQFAVFLEARRSQSSLRRVRHSGSCSSPGLKKTRQRASAALVHSLWSGLRTGWRRQRRLSSKPRQSAPDSKPNSTKGNEVRRNFARKPQRASAHGDHGTAGLRGPASRSHDR